MILEYVVSRSCRHGRTLCLRMVVPRHFALNCWTDTRAAAAAGALRAGVEWTGAACRSTRHGGTPAGGRTDGRASGVSEGNKKSGEEEAGLLVVVVLSFLCSVGLNAGFSDDDEPSLTSIECRGNGGVVELCCGQYGER